MKHRALFAAAVICIVLIAAPAMAWEFSGQVLTRVEGRDGYRRLPLEPMPGEEPGEETPGTDPTWFIGQRTRLTGSHETDNHVGMFIQLADVRVWGGESSTLTDFSANAFDLHQGYVNIKLNDLWKLRIGRQEIAYDGHRIFGTVGWTLQARSHDAVRVIYKKDELTGNLVLAHNEAGQNLFSTDYPYTSNYRDLVLLWGRYNGGNYQASGIILYDSYTSHDDVMAKYPSRFTLGPRIAGKAGEDGKFSYRAEAYYQMGTVWLPEGDIDIAAMMFGLRGGYDFGDFVLTGWLDFLSGDKWEDADDDGKDDDGKYGAFDTPYPTNHKFYGWADYFLNIPNDTQNKGLIDIAAKVKIKKIGPFSGQVHLHHFQLAQELEVPGEDGADATMEKGLGWEVDAVLSLPIVKGSTLSVGVSHVEPNDALKQLKRGGKDRDYVGAGNWAWAMLNVNVKD